MDWEYSGKLFRGASAEKLLGLAGEIPREFWEGMDIKGMRSPRRPPTPKHTQRSGLVESTLGSFSKVFSRVSSTTLLRIGIWGFPRRTGVF